MEPELMEIFTNLEADGAATAFSLRQCNLTDEFAIHPDADAVQ